MHARGLIWHSQKLHRHVLSCTAPPQLDIIACRCSITKCAEDGIVAQDRSRVEMEACTVSACKGPALDLTMHAQASVADSSLTNCSGAFHTVNVNFKGLWISKEHLHCSIASTAEIL